MEFILEKKDIISEELTPRELTILEKILEGMNNAEIAKNLGISKCTVKSHRQNIYDKLGIHSVPELLKLYWR